MLKNSFSCGGTVWVGMVCNFSPFSERTPVLHSKGLESSTVKDWSPMRWRTIVITGQLGGRETVLV